MSNGSIWLIDWTISGTTALGQNEPESDGNEWVLRIPENSSITSLTIKLFCVLSLFRDAVDVFTAPAD